MKQVFPLRIVIFFMFYSYFECFFSVIITNEGNDCQNYILYEWNLGVKLESLGQLRDGWCWMMEGLHQRRAVKEGS